MTGLTKEQQSIIAHKTGPAYVVAGAGTGKTFTMTARVQALIESGVDPEHILVLTFTNAAANEMKKRVQTNVGDLAKRITACTYHSFCNILMRRYGVPSHNYTILDSGDDEDLIKFVKANSIYADIKLPRASVLKDIYSKRINCRMDYPQILADPKYAKIRSQINDIRDFYQILQDYKRKHNLVNYDDMLVYCVNILKSQHGESIRNRYQYVMVDEAQDTNYIQFLITGYLSRNIMYIGDPEQSIYGFRGSDLDLYLSVPERFKASIYTLSNNYRCTQQILDVANSVIEQDNIPYKAILKTGKGYWGEKPVLCIPESQDLEAEHILNEILNMSENENTAVIYRNSAMSARLELGLVVNKIDYIKRGGVKFFEMECIRDMMALFRLIVNPHDYLAWFRTLQNNRRIGEKRANQIVGDGEDPLRKNPFRKQKNKTAVEICAQLDKLECLFSEINGSEYEKQIELVRNYYLKLRDDNLEFLRGKSKISEKTIEAEEASVNNAKTYVPILAKLMTEYQSVRDFLESIALDATAIPGDIAAIGQKNEGVKGETESRVVLTTIHSAKGLEWDNVCIMDAVQGIFPSGDAHQYNSDEDAEKAIAEERRCMYVAVTRARKKLTVYCPEAAVLYGAWHPGTLSEFLVPALEKELFEVRESDNLGGKK